MITKMSQLGSHTFSRATFHRCSVTCNLLIEIVTQLIILAFICFIKLDQSKYSYSFSHTTLLSSSPSLTVLNAKCKESSLFQFRELFKASLIFIAHLHHVTFPPQSHQGLLFFMIKNDFIGFIQSFNWEASNIEGRKKLQ